MSNVIRRQFSILDASVEGHHQVFDHLVEVEDIQTGERGKLLCSHYCKWPKGLIPDATWLEGCYTPKEWKDDPRLALGYHPSSVTSWEADYSTRVITISTTVNEGEWDGDEPVPEIPQQFYLEGRGRLLRFNSTLRALDRATGLSRLGQTVDRIWALCSAIDRAGLPGWLKNHIVEILGIQVREYHEEDPIYEPHMERDHQGFSTVYAPPEGADGFMEAVRLPYFYMCAGGIKVERNLREEGFHVGDFLPYERTEDSLEVQWSAHGYSPAVPIECHEEWYEHPEVHANYLKHSQPEVYEEYLEFLNSF